jgi:hypothetical protein
VKRLLGLALVVIGLTSCVGSRPAHIESSVHTGSNVAYGSSHNVWSSTGQLVVRTFITSDSDYGFTTVYRSDDKIRAAEAWSFGKKFRFVKGENIKRGCRECSATELGAVFMSDSDFNSAAVNGFEFELRGTSGHVTGQVPARAFSEVLGLQAKLGLTGGDMPGHDPAKQNP